MTTPPSVPLSDTVLLVDDDPNLLAALRRSIGRSFHILAAEGPAIALDMLKQLGQPGVIVSDMSMPEMTGVEFIVRARESCPNTSYILLTGNADQKTAVDAVNQGHILRFLSKPCPREDLEAAIRDGLEIHRLKIVERELLQRTLTGSISVLVQVLQMARPRLFRQGDRMRKAARALALKLKVADPWCVEIAAMLSFIGCITLPDDLVESAFKGAELSDDERRLFRSHSAAGADLLKRIPRLEAAAEIVRLQYEDDASMRTSANQERFRVAAQIVAVVRDIDLALARGEPFQVVLDQLSASKGKTDPDVLRAAQELAGEIFRISAGGDLRRIPVRKLIIGMVLQEDIRTLEGELLISAGHEVTDALLARIRNYARRCLTQEEVTVLVPKDLPAESTARAA